MMILKKNIGYTESVIRVVIGSLIVVAGLYVDSYLGLIGLIPVISGAVSFCPLYRFLNLSTMNPTLEREN